LITSPDFLAVLTNLPSTLLRVIFVGPPVFCIPKHYITDRNWCFLLNDTALVFAEVGLLCLVTMLTPSTNTRAFPEEFPTLRVAFSGPYFTRDHNHPVAFLNVELRFKSCIHCMISLFSFFSFFVIEAFPLATHRSPLTL